MSALTTKIERRLEEETGLYVAIEEEGEKLVLTGVVSSEEERLAAYDVVARTAGDREIEDNLEISETLPGQVQQRELEPDDEAVAHGVNRQAGDEYALEPGDFTEQRLQKSAQRAPGPDSSVYDDEVAEGDNVYVPPSDPTVRGREVIGGLQMDSMESIDVERSELDNDFGDEALQDAILRELREDRATTYFDIDVQVEQKVAHLRGRVPDVEDAENVEAVAARVPGLLDIVEELDVEATE